MNAFFISCATTLGKKLADLAKGYVSDKISETAEQKGYSDMVNVLELELHAVKTSIRDISVAHFRSALDELEFALTDIRTYNQNTLRRPVATSDVALTSLDPPQYLSEDAKNYIDSAEKNAQLAFSSIENVPFTMRISAMQIKAACIGLKIANQPKRLGELWKKCLDKVLEDQVSKKVIADEQSYREGGGTSLVKRFYAYYSPVNPDEWRKLNAFCWDILSAMLAISPNISYYDGFVDYYKSLSICKILYKKELISDACDFKIKSQFIIRPNGFRIDNDTRYQANCLADRLEESKLFYSKNPVNFVESLTCLPDGSFVFATSSHTVFKYSANFQQLASRKLECKRIVYDPSRKSIWYWNWDRGNGKQIEIDADNLCETGFTMKFPSRLGPWVEASITKSGWMIGHDELVTKWSEGTCEARLSDFVFETLAAVSLKHFDFRNRRTYFDVRHRVWAKYINGIETGHDKNVEISCFLGENTEWVLLHSIAVMDHASTHNSNIVKVAVLTEMHVVIRTLELFKDNATYNLKPSDRIVYLLEATPERGFNSSCAFCENGDVVAQTSRNRLKIYNYGLGPVDVSTTELNPADQTIVEVERLWTRSGNVIVCEDIRVLTSTLHKTGKSETNNFIRVVDISNIRNIRTRIPPE